MQRRQGNVESETAAAATTFADEIKGENASIPLYRLVARLLQASVSTAALVIAFPINLID